MSPFSPSPSADTYWTAPCCRRSTLIFCPCAEGMDGEEELYEGRINRDQFDNPKTLPYPNDAASGKAIDLFDRGYALTVHKAQGSEAKKVILFEQPTRLWEGEMWNRWLYTGVTRAQEELIIVGRR